MRAAGGALNMLGQNDYEHRLSHGAFSSANREAAHVAVAADDAKSSRTSENKKRNGFLSLLLWLREVLRPPMLLLLLVLMLTLVLVLKQKRIRNGKN